MEFKLIKENEDGSADYQLHLEDDEAQDIIRSVIMRALYLAAKDGKNYDPGDISVDNTSGRGEDSVHGEGEQPSEPESTSDGFKTSQVLG